MNMSILDSLLCVIIKDRGVIQGFLKTGNQAFLEDGWYLQVFGDIHKSRAEME